MTLPTAWGINLTHNVSFSRWGKCIVSARCSCRSRTGLYKIPSHSTGIVSCRPLRASKSRLLFTMEVIKILAKGCGKESMMAESELGNSPPRKGGTHTLPPSVWHSWNMGHHPRKKTGLNYCTVKTRSETKVNTAHVWFVISLQLSNCLLYSKGLQGKSGSRLKESVRESALKMLNISIMGVQSKFSYRTHVSIKPFNRDTSLVLPPLALAMLLNSICAFS